MTTNKMQQDFSEMPVGELVKMYEQLQQVISRRFYRVVRISDRYSAICYMTHNPMGIETKLIDSATSLEIKMLDSVEAHEHIAYGTFVATISKWLADELPHECPVESDAAALTMYRAATGIDAE